MIDTFLNLHSYMRERLARALESGLLVAPYSLVSVRSVLGNTGNDEIPNALNELDKLGISGKGAAVYLQSIEQAYAQIPKPDLVWSGPEVAGLHARDTRRVYEELLGSANHSIWASTYAFFDGPRAFEVLAQRMETRGNLQVTLLLNIQRKRGDTRNADYLVRAFAEHFWKYDWPGRSRPQVYYDPRALELDGPAGVLHAKAVVADDEAVFVTSANLTEAALDRNIEIGLLVRDRALALSITCHFRGLIDCGLLFPLPMD